MNDQNNNNQNHVPVNTGRHMGDFVTWSLAGMKNRKEVDQYLIDLGFTTFKTVTNTKGVTKRTAEKEIEIPDVSSINCSKRAVDDLLCVRGLKSDYTIEKIEKGSKTEKMVWAIIGKEIVETGTLVNDPTLTIEKDARFETKMWISFDSPNYYNGTKSARDLFTVSHPDHPLMQRAVALYNAHLESYTTNDIRTGFQRAFQNWDGIKLKKDGGLYWVPSTQVDRVQQWKKFMELTDNTAMVFPQFDAKDTIESLQAQTRESLEGQLEEVQTALASYIGGDKTRTSTLTSRVEEFDTILAKAELYESLLGNKLDTLKSDVEAAKTALLESLKNPTSN